jgi:hypothetical protein
MSLTSTILKAGALYALGRFTANVSADDVKKVTGISGEDLRRYGLDRADSLLGVMGLQRQATVPSSTIMVLSGFAAGAVVGAGVTFLFYSEQGKDVRRKVAEYFTKSDEEKSETTEARTGNGSETAKA